MPPNEQERQCAQLVCQHLNQTLGGDWAVECWLDGPHQSEPSPDVLITNVSDRVTLEIKQLTDGETFHNYEVDLRALHRRLAPHRSQSFVLFPPPSLRLPLAPSMIGTVKRGVADAAPGLDVGDVATVAVRRRATVKHFPRPDGGLVFCSHADSSEFSAVPSEVSGFFSVEDDGPDHQFLTEKYRSAFRRELQRACRQSRQEGRAEMRWSEEWALQRTRDPLEREGGVLVMAAEGDFLESAAIRSVEKALCAAKKKFRGREWSGRAAVALHTGRQQDKVAPALFADAVAALEPADIEPLELVFLVNGYEVRQFTFSK